MIRRHCIRRKHLPPPTTNTRLLHGHRYLQRESERAQAAIIMTGKRTMAMDPRFHLAPISTRAPQAGKSIQAPQSPTSKTCKKSAVRPTPYPASLHPTNTPSPQNSKPNPPSNPAPSSSTPAKPTAPSKKHGSKTSPPAPPQAPKTGSSNAKLISALPIAPSRMPKLTLP